MSKVLANQDAPLRWGIVTTGLISNDFVIAMTTLNPAEHVAHAVAARSLENAEKFAKEHNIQKWYGSYEELFKDPEIGKNDYFQKFIFLTFKARFYEFDLLICRHDLHWFHPSTSFTSGKGGT